MTTRFPLSYLFFAILLGPAMAQHTSAAPKSPHGMFDILSDQVSESQPCWNNPAIDGVRWRGGWNRIQKTVDGGLPTWRGVDGFPAQVAGNKFVSRA